MFQFEEEAMLVQDREDLLQLLRMRFGEISPTIIQKIYDVQTLDALERLFLVAANGESLGIFLEELEAPEDSFKLALDKFNPMSYITEKRKAHGE